MVLEDNLWVLSLKDETCPRSLEEGEMGCLGLWFPDPASGQVLLAGSAAFMGPGQSQKSKDHDGKLFQVLAGRRPEYFITPTH